MRKDLQKIPTFVPVGHITPATADHLVATGGAHSLRGKAILLLDRSKLERIASGLLDPEAAAEVVEMILRAAARVEAEKAAAASVAHSGAEEVR